MKGFSELNDKFEIGRHLRVLCILSIQDKSGKIVVTVVVNGSSTMRINLKLIDCACNIKPINVRVFFICSKLKKSSKL